MAHLIWIPLLLLTARPVVVEKVGGEQLEGSLAEWQSGRVVIDTAAAQVTLAAAELTAVRFVYESGSAPSEWPVVVELADGSTLAGIDYQAQGRWASVEVPQVVQLPLASVAAVHWRGAAEAAERQWTAIRRQDLASDLLVIRKGDALDYLNGIVGDVTATAVRFQFDGEAIPVRRAKVAGIVYYRRGKTVPAADSALRVMGPGATAIEAAGVALAPNGLVVTTADGTELTLPDGYVRVVDFSIGRSRYLSDLAAETSEWTPFFGAPPDAVLLGPFGGPRNDRSLAGGPLQVGGKTYDKGLALRSRTVVTYRLPRGFRQFTCVAGLDDRAGRQGHVRLLVRGDNADLLDVDLGGQDEPLPVSIDISGRRRLTIVVDYGDNMDVADHLDLCDAKISK